MAGIMKKFETGKEITGEIIRILEKGIILQLKMMWKGLFPWGRSKKSRREVLQIKSGDILPAMLWKSSQMIRR
ncbi:MAG: hypothetical protein CM1200mP10_30970 [Candidatus Neomarinimicrobiota bacterium]|nr:MAG: hypothetical protein CM1200mP10_30970 [Candidatus Neomarinimicrobiota bacterium]